MDSLYNDSTRAYVDSAGSLGTMPWDSLFRDRCLRALVNRALENNTDLRVAFLRVDQAAASLNAAKLAYLPSLTFSPGGAITSVDGNKASKTYEIPVSLSWEIDLFGKLRNAKRESQAQLLGQTAYAQAVRSRLISSVAEAYYSLLMFDEQIDISTATIELWKEQLRAMELQLKVGDIRANAVSQARANLEQLLAANNGLMRQPVGRDLPSC